LERAVRLSGKRKPRQQVATGAQIFESLLGSQNFVENACGLLFVGLLSQCQF
jgi:hypothetical protein